MFACFYIYGPEADRARCSSIAWVLLLLLPRLAGCWCCLLCCCCCVLSGVWVPPLPPRATGPLSSAQRFTQGKGNPSQFFQMAFCSSLLYEMRDPHSYPHQGFVCEIPSLLRFGILAEIVAFAHDYQIRVGTCCRIRPCPTTATFFCVLFKFDLEVGFYFVIF